MGTVAVSRRRRLSAVMQSLCPILWLVVGITISAGNNTSFGADAERREIRGQRVYTLATVGNSGNRGTADTSYLSRHVASMAEQLKIAGHVKCERTTHSGYGEIRYWNDQPNRDNEVKAALQEGSVDVLICAGVDMLHLPDQGVELFVDFALKHNPNVRVLVEQQYLVGDAPRGQETAGLPDRDAKTPAQLRELHTAEFRALTEFVGAINKKHGKQVVFTVPVGEAVLRLRELTVAGKVAGITKQSQLFDDKIVKGSGGLGTFTVTTIGPGGGVTTSTSGPAPMMYEGFPLKILRTYCHLCVLYRQSPVGLPTHMKLPDSSKFSTEDYRSLHKLLRQIAWESATDDPLSGVALPAAALNFRNWKSADGNFSVSAEFVGLASDVVTIRREDGSDRKIPIEKLSPGDKEWVRSEVEVRIKAHEQQAEDAWHADLYTKGAFVKYEEDGNTCTIIVGQHFLTLDDKSANRFLRRIHTERVAEGNFSATHPATIALDAGGGKTENLGTYDRVRQFKRLKAK